MMRRLGSALLRLTAGVGYAYVYLPFALIILLSFNDSPAATLPFRGFTLKWYDAMLTNSNLIASFRNTIVVGLIVMVISTVFGTFIALSLRYRRGRWRAVYEFFLGLPFLLPEIVMAVAALSFFNFVGLRLSFATIIVGHVMVTLVIAVRTVGVRLAQIPPSLEEASLDLGRSPFASFFLVTMPNLRTALLNAALLTFTISFDLTIMTFLVAGTENLLPTYVWAQLRLGFRPDLNSVAAVIFLVSSALGVLVALRTRTLSDA